MPGEEARLCRCNEGLRSVRCGKSGFRMLVSGLLATKVRNRAFGWYNAQEAVAPWTAPEGERTFIPSPIASTMHIDGIHSPLL